MFGALCIQILSQGDYISLITLKRRTEESCDLQNASEKMLTRKLPSKTMSSTFRRISSKPRFTMLGVLLLPICWIALTPIDVDASDWEVETRSITIVAQFSGNTPVFWGYHQPIIVRAGSRVYAGLLQPWDEDHQQQWALYELNGDNWKRIYLSSESKMLNQPPSLLVDEQDRVHVFAWLDGVCNHLRFDPDSESSDPFEEIADVGYDDLWPYAGAATNTSGDLLVVPSAWPNHRYGYLQQGSETWQQGTIVEFADRPDSPSNVDRHTYPFVALRDREAHVFSTQDIIDAEKVAAGESFTFVFRTLEYYYSPDLLNEPYETLNIVDVQATTGWAHNDDMLIDQDGDVHILYRFQERENESAISALMHAFGPPGGPLTHVGFSSDGWANEGRLWEAPNGVLFIVRVLDDDLVVERVAEDGRRLGSPASLGVRPETGDYTSSRVFLAASRASVFGAPFLEGLYQTQSPDGTRHVHSFHAKLPELLADVLGDGTVDFGDFLAFAGSFNTLRGQAGFSSAADTNADGTVDFADFLEFARGYSIAAE